MRKGYIYKLSRVVLIVSLLLCAFKLSAQTYGSKPYYLVDSLDLETLADSEKKLIDSALVIYHQAKHDTLKIDAVNIIVEESWNDQVWPKYNQWIYNYIQEKLASKTFKKKKEASELRYLLINKSGALNNFGVFHHTQGNYPKALESYLESLKIKEGINDLKGMSSIYNNIGGIYDREGKSTKALEYYLKGMKIREKIGDKKGLSISFNNVGQIYYNQGDIEKALHYFQKSLTVNPEVKNWYGRAAILNNIGVIYQSKNEMHLALKYFNESIAIKEKIGDHKGIVISLNSIGGIFRDQKNYEKALEYYERSNALSKKINDKEGLAISLNNFGNVYFLVEKLNLAKIYCHKSMTIARDLKDPILIRDAAVILARIHKKEKQYKKALEMHELYIVMRDSVSNKEIEKDIIRQKAIYDLDKKEQEIILLSSQNEIQELKLVKNRILVILFSTAFGLMLILVFLVFRGNKKKKVIYKLLKKQKEDISLKNEEKKVMLKEIHHRVKNNLQVVNSLLRFQSREIEDKKILGMFEIAQKRVLSMAMLHEKMYRSEDLKYIDVKEHFTLLIEDLVKNYAIEKKITLDIDVDDIDLGIEVLTPLGLIINELITNSLKHAFNNKMEGTISVSLKENNGNYILKVEDDGEEYIDTKKETGLGTKLVQLFTKQLNGTLEQLEEPGTVFKLVFRKNDIN